MCTTLNIADDVLFAVRERAMRERRTIGEVLSDLARQALIGPSVQGRPPSERVAEEGSFHGFEPLPHRGVAVSNELIDRLRDAEPE